MALKSRGYCLLAEKIPHLKSCWACQARLPGFADMKALQRPVGELLLSALKSSPLLRCGVCQPKSAVNPSLGAWRQHPCCRHLRLTHPAPSRIERFFSGKGVKKGRALTLGKSSLPIGLKRLLPVLLVSCLCVTGCTLVKETLALPDKAVQSVARSWIESEKIDPVELQSQLIRFSDHYLEIMNSAASRLRIQNEQQPERRGLLRRQIVIINDVLAIATGSNAYANLLDMVILATLNRSNAEYAMSKRYGESAKLLVTAARDAEKQIWRIAEATLPQAQVDELRSNIQNWLNQQGEGYNRREVGTLGLSSEIAKLYKTSRPDQSSVFSLLTIDPFAGLDPATRELANTRLFAERGLFLTRHMPTLLSLETELLAIQSLEIPKLDGLLASIDQLALAADRFSLVSAQLPSVIGTEREHLVQALDQQRPGLISLAAQTEKALIAGHLMSAATTHTLQSFRDIVQQLQSTSDPNAEAFKIGDYTAMATELNQAAEQLTQLLKVVGDTLAQERFDALAQKVEFVSQQVENHARETVDYAFKRLLVLGLLLMGGGCLMFLITYVCYRRLKLRYFVSRP